MQQRNTASSDGSFGTCRSSLFAGGGGAHTRAAQRRRSATARWQTRSVRSRARPNVQRRSERLRALGHVPAEWRLRVQTRLRARAHRLLSAGHRVAEAALRAGLVRFRLFHDAVEPLEHDEAIFIDESGSVALDAVALVRWAGFLIPQREA